jgi:hypothetical protein
MQVTLHACQAAIKSVLFDNGTVVGVISWVMARYNSGLVLILPVFSLLATSYMSW